MRTAAELHQVTIQFREGYFKRHMEYVTSAVDAAVSNGDLEASMILCQGDAATYASAIVAELRGKGFRVKPSEKVPPFRDFLKSYTPERGDLTLEVSWRHAKEKV